MKNTKTAYRITCMFCGQINHAEVPLVGLGDTMTFACDNCQKILIEFHSHEIEDHV